MTRSLTEAELIEAVQNLTSERLSRFLSARIVIPRQSDKGLVYERLDMARLQLACELDDQYEMEPDALSMVLSLIDQIHGLRAELREVLRVIDTQPDPVRSQLVERIGAARFRRS